MGFFETNEKLLLIIEGTVCLFLICGPFELFHMPPTLQLAKFLFRDISSEDVSTQAVTPSRKALPVRAGTLRGKDARPSSSKIAPQCFGKRVGFL